MKNPFRFWMTSGVAIMVAAVSGGRSFAGEDRVAMTRVSRYGMSETLQRLEASAQRHGMHVLAFLPQQADTPTSESHYLLVLESSQGGTPVQMATADSQPDLLLSVVLRNNRAGGTEVFVMRDDLPEGVSASLQSDFAELPAMVEEALAA